MLKIILVDNDPNFRKGLKAVLTNIGGIEVIAEANNGAELLNILSNELPDLIFMDIRMPIIDGVRTTKIVKTLYPSIHIIGFSSYYDVEYKNNMLEAGASDYLVKSEDNYIKLKEIIEQNCSQQNDGTKNKLFNQ
ncbi:MAG: response regulator transcription factor [Bacteroidales bacterium]|nr:response regulator transcription factor [Bacteroidales bacterium]